MNPINLPKPLIQLQLDEVLKNKGKTIIQNNLQKKFYVTVRNNPHIIPDDVFGLALLLNKEADIFIENKNHYFGANFALCTWVKVFESIQNELCFTCISATKSSGEIWFGIKAGKLILRSGSRVIFSSTTDFPINEWTTINLVFQEQGNSFAGYKVFVNNQELTAGAVPTNELNTFKYISIAHGIDANNSNVPLGLGGFEFYEQPLSLDMLKTVTQKGLIVKKTFNESYPLDFLLSTNDTLNTLYIKDKGTQNTFTFQLKNSLQENLEFKAKPTTNIPLDQGILSGVAPSFYHVKLTFRPKIFETSPASTAWKYLHCSNPPNNWTVAEFLETNGNVSLFFTYTGTTSLVFEAGKEIDFGITYNNIEKTLGSRLTQAMLGYENIVYQNEPTKGYVSGNRKHPINIVNHSGEKNIPILAGIVKNDTILNTSDTGDTNQEKKSRLYIRLKNIHKKNSIQFNDKTQLTVSFDTSDKHWALTTGEGSKSITLDLLNSSLTPDAWALVRTEDQGLSRVFVIQQFRLNELKPNESLDFEIGNIFTDKVSGETPIYIKYKNIPTYQDGQFIVKVKKGPIVEGDFNDAKNIGIGVNADKDYQLKIGGNLKIEADANGGNIVDITNKDSTKTYMRIRPQGNTDIVESFEVGKDANIKGKLHVGKETNIIGKLNVRGETTIRENLTVENTAASQKVLSKKMDVYKEILQEVVDVEITDANEKSLMVSKDIQKYIPKQDGYLSKVELYVKWNASGSYVVLFMKNETVLESVLGTYVAGDFHWETFSFYNKIEVRKGEEYGIKIIYRQPLGGSPWCYLRNPNTREIVYRHKVKINIIKEKKPVGAVHYGNRGVFGAATSFNADRNINGLWIESRGDGSESSGMFINDNTMCLWSPGDNDILRVYDEDAFHKNPRFKINNGGDVYITGTYKTQGADYAEYFESTDGKEISVGTSVVIDNGKIRPAILNEIPIGVISVSSSVIGNSPTEWKGKYLKDDYGRVLMEEVETSKSKKKKPILNPNYDESLPYVERKDRPEWNCVGLLGQLALKKGEQTAPNWVKIKDISDEVALWLIK